MSSSIMAFEFTCETVADVSSVWPAFCRAFVGSIVDPIGCYVGHCRACGIGQQWLDGSAPFGDWVRLESEVYLPQLELTRLTDRDRYFDLRVADANAYRTIATCLEHGDAEVSLLGPVRLWVPSPAGMVREWFHSAEVQRSGHVYRQPILEVGLTTDRARQAAVLSITSLAPAWSEVGAWGENDGDGR